MGTFNLNSHNFTSDNARYYARAFEKCNKKVDLQPVHLITLEEAFGSRTKRAVSALLRAEVFCLADLIAFKFYDLRKFRGIGDKALSEISEVVKSFGLGFETGVIGYNPDVFKELRSQYAEQLVDVDSFKLENIHEFEEELKPVHLVYYVDIDEFPARHNNVFKFSGLYYLADIVSKKKEFFTMQKRVGKVFMSELERILALYGLKLDTKVIGWNRNKADELRKQLFPDGYNWQDVSNMKVN